MASSDAWLGAKVSLVRLKNQEHAEAAGASSVRQLVRKDGAGEHRQSHTCRQSGWRLVLLQYVVQFAQP